MQKLYRKWILRKVVKGMLQKKRRPGWAALIITYHTVYYDPLESVMMT
jgi:hypothetical protein